MGFELNIRKMHYVYGFITPRLCRLLCIVNCGNVSLGSAKHGLGDVRQTVLPSSTGIPSAYSDYFSNRGVLKYYVNFVLKSISSYTRQDSVPNKLMLSIINNKKLLKK